MEKEQIAHEIRSAMSKFKEALADPAVKEKVHSDPVNTFLSFTSENFQNIFTDDHKRQLEELIPETRRSPVSPRLEDLGIILFASGSFWGGVACYSCEIGLTAGIIAAFAGVFALTAGAAIAPLIAAEAGFIPVIAAMTGLSEATVAGIAGAGGLTLEGLIAGCCSAMGAC